MAKVILGTTMSLDGFINDRKGSVGRLYADLAELRDGAGMKEAVARVGAEVMGRRTYEMGNGDFTGYEFQVPLFVVTHQAPAQVARGANDRLSFTFVTDGVKSAIDQARAAAAGRDVTVVGGADVGQQLLRMGLVDELHIDIVPWLLGAGTRLFEKLDIEPTALERTKLRGTGPRTELEFRILR
jgi:dihydrofolate reductase